MFSDLSSKFSKGIKSIGLGKDEEAIVVDGVELTGEDAECFAEWGMTLAQEEILLQQLRDELNLEVKLTAEWDHDYLCRYLRARKHDILKAKTMVLDTLKWRAEVGADEIFESFTFEEKELFHKNYPEGFYCTDRAGRPVYVQQPGNIDCPELWKFTTLDRTIKYHIRQQETYVRRIAPAAGVVAKNQRYQSLVLIDLEGVGVSTITGEVRTIMGKIMSIDQDYYPELMYKALIVNAPTSFRVIWSMVKYLLDSRTQGKIEVLSVDYAPELLKHIAPENLMEKYGGANKEPLINEPGPWRDEAVLAEVLRREQERTEKALGAPASQ